MQLLDFKNKTGKLNNLDANQKLLFVEKILSQHNTAPKTIGRLNCHAWML